MVDIIIRPGMYDDPAMQKMADMLDDDVVAELRIRVHRNGAMSVTGCINEENFAIACLQQAIQTIKDHNSRQKIDLIVPHYDTPLR
jgi:hypothetical protein